MSINREAIARLGLDVTDENGSLWLREDVGVCGEDEEQHDVVWSQYLYIQDSLRGIGLTIKDVYLEHDCITGVIMENPEAIHPDVQTAIDIAAEIIRLQKERSALISAAIVETGAVYVWHLGASGGHEPTRELARSAVRRAAGIADVDLRGTVVKYEEPFGPACPPGDWEANGEGPK